MTQYSIVGLDLNGVAETVSCPQCKAQPGQPCTIKRQRHPDIDYRSHAGRGDKASRQRMKDLYGCRRCEYACDCSPHAARWLPSMTVIERAAQ